MCLRNVFTFEQEIISSDEEKIRGEKFDLSGRVSALIRPLKNGFDQFPSEPSNTNDVNAPPDRPVVLSEFL